MVYSSLGDYQGKVVKNLLANAGTQETKVWSLGQEDPLEYKMATHLSILKNPMDRGVWRATVHGVTKSQTRLSGLSTHRHTNLLPFKGFALPLTSPHLTTGGGVFRAGDHPSPFLVQWIISAYLCRTWTLLHWCQRHWVQKGPSLGPPDPRANTRTRWSNSLLGFHTIKYILLYFTFLHYELYCQLSENRKLC